MRADATVHIAAPPEKVWALVSDVTRMGEWSPETYRAEWIEGATGPAVGARFKGWNKRGWFRWSTKVRVEKAEPGREFSFVTMAGSKDQTGWCYRLEPSADGGTDVTESCATNYAPFIGKLLFPERRRQPQLDAGIRTTLERLRAAAEGGG